MNIWVSNDSRKKGQIYRIQFLSDIFIYVKRHLQEKFRAMARNQFSHNQRHKIVHLKKETPFNQIRPNI